MESYLVWGIGLALIAVVFFPYWLKFRSTRRVFAERREEARAMGIDKPRSQFPMVDATTCIGCGACVKACPEGDVLGVVWGVAEVINGERCVGHGLCETACPVGALKVGLGDVKTRADIPVLSTHNETSVPGIFIAGELGGISLIRNAVNQGKLAVNEIARRIGQPTRNDVYDVVIVGAGPAGIAASLTAIQHGLNYLVIDEREIGGTILKYPRKKLVMTQPLELPLYGWLKQDEYSKEFLVETWQEIKTRFNLNVRTGERVESVTLNPKCFDIRTTNDLFQARFLVLALGRRGTPRKMDVPGEELSKIMYTLTDAQSYSNQHVLVVGGGDSAVEAAVGLAKQPGNVVTISYRKSSFFRVKKKNEIAVNKLIKEKKIIPLFNSQVIRVSNKSAILNSENGQVEIPNDYVIVQIGGIPPFEMLKEMGIAFGGEAKKIIETTSVDSHSLSAK